MMEKMLILSFSPVVEVLESTRLTTKIHGRRLIRRDQTTTNYDSQMPERDMLTHQCPSSRGRVRGRDECEMMEVDEKEEEFRIQGESMS